MTPSEYQALASRTECDQLAASKRHYQYDRAQNLLATRLNHSAIGLAGEVGELCGAVERWLQYGKELDRTNIIEEAGDALWYLALACNALGVSLEEVMEKNIAKLKLRYPEKYTDFNAAEENRNRTAEREVLETVVSKEAISSSTDEQKHIQSLIPLAIAKGWVLYEPELCTGMMKPWLYFPDDESEDWAARWIPVTVGEVEASAPHWLGRRMLELGHISTGSLLPFPKPVTLEDSINAKGHSYVGKCEKCGIPIHKNNTIGLCPDCAAYYRAKFSNEVGVAELI